jgi:tetratricopeptide (TPR) repeat protein
LLWPRRRLRAAVVLAAALGAAGAASAQVRNLTWGELSLTPPVCMDVQGIPLTGWVHYHKHSPRAAHWEAVMGKSFWAMHHYCWALVHQLRANRPGTPAQERVHLHREAIGDYYYVINDALSRGETDFVMLPEIYYRTGDAYLQIGDLGAALLEFEKSRAAKADYWPAYAGLASIHERVGRRKEAREILERGLEIMPGEPNLVAALSKLGAGDGRSAPAASRRAVSASAASAKTEPASASPAASGGQAASAASAPSKGRN